jgi:hypothetical protein
MHYKLVDKKPKTFVLVFETNDELAGILHAFASEQKLASASFKAIGALSSVKLGWLNWRCASRSRPEPNPMLPPGAIATCRLRTRCLSRSRRTRDWSGGVATSLARQAGRVPEAIGGGRRRRHDKVEAECLSRHRSIASMSGASGELSAWETS